MSTSRHLKLCFNVHMIQMYISFLLFALPLAFKVLKMDK